MGSSGHHALQPFLRFQKPYKQSLEASIRYSILNRYLTSREPKLQLHRLLTFRQSPIETITSY